MKFRRSANYLNRLAQSNELRTLQQKSVRTRRTQQDKLKTLDESPDLADLANAMAKLQQAPTLFEILERSERLKHTDEHLHSRFLEFLLTGTEDSSLASVFLTSLTREARFYHDARRVPSPELTGPARDVQIKREAALGNGGDRVDFRIRSEKQACALLIENKIQHGERPRQLLDYWNSAESDNPTFAIGGLFLTPDGRPPRTAGKRDWVSIRYSRIADLLVAACRKCPRDSRTTVAGEYIRAIRRWFVQDPEMKAIAWRIYQKFPEAIAYLADEANKPASQICEKLQALVKQNDELQLLDRSVPEGGEVWFVPREWEQMPGLRNADTADKSAEGRLLIFWTGWTPEHKQDYKRDLIVYLGTPKGARVGQVNGVLRAIQGGRVPRSTAGIGSLHTSPQDDWTFVWARRLLSESLLKHPNSDTVFERIENAWEQMLRRDLPRIKSAIANLPFCRNRR